MAFVRELVRQKRRGLVLVGVVHGNDADTLAGAGCLARIETSYVGLEAYGLARCFRRAVEAGALEVVDYPELLSWDRFRASEANMTFLPARFLGGSDIAAAQPRDRPVRLPAHRAPAVGRAAGRPRRRRRPRARADVYGNVLYPERRLLPQSLDITLSRSCDTVIVTAERIVGNAEVRRNAHLTEIASYRTTHVVEAPWGAHPCPVLGLLEDRRRGVPRPRPRRRRS